MNLGDLVTTTYTCAYLYKDISGDQRYYIDKLQPKSLGVILNKGFSLSDEVYFKVVLSTSNVGWIKGNLLSLVKMKIQKNKFILKNDEL